MKKPRYLSQVLLVYKDVDRPAIQHAVLKKGFQHVEPYLRMDDGTYLRMMSSNGTAYCLPMTKEQVDSEVKKASHFQEVVRIKQPRKNTAALFIGSNNCTGLTKIFIGLRKLFILTPYQLFKYINKHDLDRCNKGGQHGC